MPLSSPTAATEAGLELLRQLYPPQMLVHVGIGNGAGPMQCWQRWSSPANAVLIDADASRIQWAKALTAKHPHWHLLGNVLLDHADGQSLYHRASNPDEDGLLDPDALKAFWPNLRKLEQTERVTQPLGRLLSELNLGESPQPSSCAWLLIDCLPADRILRGATDLLQHATVIWARVLLQPIGQDAQDANEATLGAVEAVLEPLGFRSVQVSESNHPAVGYALFVRDWASQLAGEVSKAAERHQAETEKQSKITQQLEQQLEQQRQALKQAQTNIAELNQSLEQRTQAKTQAEAKTEELKQTLDAAQAKAQQQANELKKQLETAKTETKQQLAQAEERQRELDKALESAKAEAEKQSQLAQQLEQQRQALKQAQTNIAELNQSLEQRTQAKTQAEAKTEELKQALDAAQAKAQQQANELKKQLETTKTETKQQLAQAEERQRELDKALAAAKAEAEKQSQLAQQLEQQRQALQQAQTNIAELNQSLEQRTQAKTQAEAKAEELKQTLDAAQAKAQQQANELKKQLETAKTETKQQLAQAEERQHELDKALKAAKAEGDKQAKLAAARAEQLAQRDEAYASLQRDNAIALRMQSLREVDLKDIQQRHAEVVEQKDKQAKLLRELTERLTVASRYLHQLEQQPKDAAETAVNHLEQHESGNSRLNQGSSRPSKRWWPFGKKVE
ncbi:Myosin heavy chain [Thiorhodovibrio winogradskyi]|uniref:Myosin heavy chain n=1 Tax=Thiorhodovibrio winogradskyi TaxID=77007 RepID=A0ABZ0SCE4_9GAMM|nr:hypothetical protein [Thiorhodovibrio winogradskyi]